MTSRTHLGGTAFPKGMSPMSISDMTGREG
jgi:hypothetical protein